jgi:hypothetical protein
VAVLAHATVAQKFPVSTISAELKANANVVVRQHDQSFSIASRSKATLHVHEVFTILNQMGNSLAEEVIAYDKLSRVTQFSGSIYDAQGNDIRKLKSSEIRDQSMYDGSLFSDDRLKIADLSQDTYPYTVEFEYEIEYKYLFSIPGMTVIPEERTSIESVNYTLTYPKELTPRYLVLNTEVKPSIGVVNGSKESIQWNFSNLKAIILEPLGSGLQELSPSIKAAPVQFEFEGYVGKMNSWEEFGHWINLLNKGRGELPEETQHKVRELTAQAKTDEEKIKILYEYLQNKTRYVSIQLGIGGLQPFPAAVVDKVGYGDCKALSNYMVALLRSANISSNYVLVNSGENKPPLRATFPSSQFNHAIVAVPTQNDTIWLECTSQTNPFGYQGRFTGNRKALMITEEGGKVVNTIRYKAERNIQARKAEVFLELTGDAKARVTTSYQGLQYENDDLNHILSGSFDDKKKWLEKTIDIPSFDIGTFSMSEKRDKLPSAVVRVDLVLRRFGSTSGKRIFIAPNLMNRSSFIPAKVEKRMTNVVRKFAYEDIDTVQYRFPETLYPEFSPEPISIKSKFGEYSSSFQFREGNLMYVRRIKMNEGVFPPDSYDELIDFYRNINKADNLKIVLMNKT